MKNVYRFGNEFWIEGGWTAAAYVRSGHNLRTGEIEWEVNFGAFGGGTPEEVLPRAEAIRSACAYATLCPDIFKGKSREEIQANWDEELGKFYRTTYYDWNPNKRPNAGKPT